MNAKLVLKLDSSFGKEHIISALRAFAKNLEMGIIKKGNGMSQGCGLYEEWKYEERNQATE